MIVSPLSCNARAMPVAAPERAVRVEIEPPASDEPADARSAGVEPPKAPLTSLAAFSVAGRDMERMML